jgi:hypothetical protein
LASEEVKIDKVNFFDKIMIMNTLTLQKQITTLERFIKKASRALLEFEVAQAKWEKKHKLGRTYASVNAFMRHIKSK